MTPDVSFSIASFGHTAIQYTFNCKLYSFYNVLQILDLSNLKVVYSGGLAHNQSGGRIRVTW